MKTIVLLALTVLIISCGDVADDYFYNGGISSSSLKKSSSSLNKSLSSSSVLKLSSSVVSSSSVATILSSSSGISGGGDSGNDVANYRTIKIGDQTWMAENLNYDVSGSKCYDNDPANCAKYGRLYDWATAKIVCPSGWHLPSDAEWTALEIAVGGSTIAGTKLKATSNWDTSSGYIAGTDEFGFSALPSGKGNSDGSFGNVGKGGYWWSVTEEEDDVSEACGRNMYYDHANVVKDNHDKINLYSVRCLKGPPDVAKSSSSSVNIIPSSSSVSSSSVVVILSSSSIAANYKTTQIGTQVWMAENLNDDVSGSKCYGNDIANCAKYGRLYDWATAMALPATCNSNACAEQISAKHKGICPSGWHVPSNEDWNTLIATVGESSAGMKLRATSGWGGFNGTDNFEFAALPGGYGSPDGSFTNVGIYGIFWSASVSDASNANRWGMFTENEKVVYGSISKGYLHSVRCIKD